jgi:chitosanase
MNDLQKRTCQAIVNVFESGSPTGNYGAVTLLKGDPGHLTYGRSQTTLGSGNLYSLIKAYCEAPDAQFGGELRPYLDRLAAKDLTLDVDATLRATLKEAGNDPVMRREQDAFFDRAYYIPAMNHAQSLGLELPLAQTVAYDSAIQGGWGRVSAKVTAACGPLSATFTERDWTLRYIDARRAFLLALKDPLPKTVYRMDAFLALAKQDKWDLALPLTVHGATITEASLGEPETPAIVRAAVAEIQKPILRLTTPYTTGSDVVELQKGLNAHGYKNSEDGVFGPFTQVLISQLQQSHGLKADGMVGPQTWALLQ